MNKAIEILKQSLDDGTFVNATFSGPKNKSEEIRSVLIQVLSEKETLKIELRLQKHNDIKTMTIEEVQSNQLQSWFENFKQCSLRTKDKEYQFLINKKLKAKIISKDLIASDAKKHNRSKKYLIPDGKKCDFLEEIGVMDSNGKVKPNYFKKFRQINRFLEMVDDLYSDSRQAKFHIVDFGCGKSYLTFAIYHYFTVIKKSEVKITGIDLKQEVINHCNEIAEKVGFTDLKFAHGFIHDFKTDDPIDFVVTLHACDTATDDAILFSLRNNADKMMFVPCCQHELNKQIQNNDSQILLKHGIFKDRMTALVTDTVRSQLLEACGYKVQSMEFIDMEHTAKNILLRCSKTERSSKQREDAYFKYMDFKTQWNITPYLETKLIEEKFVTL